MTMLLTFGDSWPFGAELPENSKTYCELLAEIGGVRYKNFSQPSTSIPHLVLQLIRAKEFLGEKIRGSVALFFLTSPDRDLIWDQLTPKELHLNASHPTDQDILWYSKIYTEKLAAYRTNTTLLALMKYCQCHGIVDRYVWGWQTTNLWPEIDRNLFYAYGNSTVLQMFDDVPNARNLLEYCNTPNNLYVSPNGGHPNQLGHQRIAQRLYPWLESCISNLK